jgi:ArsR family transcriptional regulator, virulence genes transcriptional regulator
MRASVARLQSNAVRAARFLKSMANPARLMVLCQLSTGEKSVGELERIVDISQSGLSQHLAVLRREGIVKTRRVGQTIQYSLAGREAALVMDVLYEVFCSKAARKSARPPKSKTAA